MSQDSVPVSQVPAAGSGGLDVPRAPGLMTTRWRLVPWVFAVLTIAGQIAWVLVGDSARTAVTSATVVTFFLASLTHALVHRGARWALPYVTITVGLGWLAEEVGTATGLPFGDYRYTSLLGPTVGSVPVVIPLAWSMMAYPCLLAAQRLNGGRSGAAALAALLFASWDLFLDPQMVAEGYWIWHGPDLELPGIPGIPAVNFLGWLIVAAVLMGLLVQLPRRSCDDTVPTVMLSWVYLSNIMAALVFFGRPAVALWGGVLMGLVVVPWWRTLWRAGWRLGSRSLAGGAQ